MSSDPALILAVLGLNIAVSEWLVRHTAARHFGSALLVIVLTAITANAGLIPTGSEPVPLYDGIFSWVAFMSIFLLLLGVRVSDVLRAGGPMVLLFLIGSLGTIAGVLAGMWAVDGPAALGELHEELGGMFVATYTGGSLNFNALAMTYGVHKEGNLYTGAVAVDSIMTAVWMVATIALPRALATVWPGRGGVPRPAGAAPEVGEVHDAEHANPLDLAILLALSAGCLWVSNVGAAALAGSGLAVPPVIILTTLALVLAQLPRVKRLAGARLLGMLGVYLFLAVIGAYCDLTALGELKSLGGTLFLFASVVVLVHGMLTFGVAALFRIDPDIAAIASQANIGGGTSALALARSLGRSDLVLPGILVGSLGTALGTYLGWQTAEQLL